MGFFAPLIPIGAKLLGAGKAAIGLTKAAGAAKGTAAVGSAMKTAAGMPGVVASSAMRPAGAKLAEVAIANPAFKSGIGKAVFGNMSRDQIGMRLSGDLMFGALGGVMTPGDIGDKLIAGTSQAVGGGLGGLALGRAAGRFGEGAAFMADAAGSIGGDFAGMAAGDAVMRGKDRLMGGQGQTPYERMSSEQQAQFEEEIRRQTLQGAGLLPGIPGQYF